MVSAVDTSTLMSSTSQSAVLTVGTFQNGRRRLVLASWVLQILVAAILFQTLFFKFTGADESVYIFTVLGAEPWGRIGSGVVELIAGVLLLVPRTISWGACLSFVVICGAVFSHLTKLGIVVKDDGGLLFGLALVVLVSSASIVLLRREIRRSANLLCRSADEICS